MKIVTLFVFLFLFSCGKELQTCASGTIAESWPICNKVEIYSLDNGVLLTSTLPFNVLANKEYKLVCLDTDVSGAACKFIPPTDGQIVEITAQR